MAKKMHDNPVDVHTLVSVFNALPQLRIVELRDIVLKAATSAVSTAVSQSRKSIRLDLLDLCNVNIDTADHDPACLACFFNCFTAVGELRCVSVCLAWLLRRTPSSPPSDLRTIPEKPTVHTLAIHCVTEEILTDLSMFISLDKLQTFAVTPEDLMDFDAISQVIKRTQGTLRSVSIDLREVMVFVDPGMAPIQLQYAPLLQSLTIGMYVTDGDPGFSSHCWTYTFALLSTAPPMLHTVTFNLEQTSQSRLHQEPEDEASLGLAYADWDRMRELLHAFPHLQQVTFRVKPQAVHPKSRLPPLSDMEKRLIRHELASLDQEGRLQVL
ncbi:hypothetical protein K474DRAFT_581409 [Panus rudis PR-1116 ss-1]|nr:hypothetical protein K474DRAFT_581409 [Panus rudis PR-1116 ss-1]